MQLTANGAHMVVDFYPVKYSDGTISERLMYKTVTFCDKVQSKSYINKVSFEKEVENRVEGYKYEVTDMHTEPQLFNSALIQTRWWLCHWLSPIFTLFKWTINSKCYHKENN